MKNKIFIIILLLLTFTFVGCNEHRRQKLTMPTKEVVKKYKVRNISTTDTDAQDEWVYWYVIYNIQLNSYYYSSSSSSTASYSSLNWSKSSTLPKGITEEEEIGEDDVDTDELGNAESEIESDISEENSMENSSDSSESSESESSDSGSSSDSGGDSGGGDGGGD